MATQRPISTISYNTEAFLKEKLDTWFEAHIIQAYQYIKHKGEDGDKDHIHLRIEPNRRLDPMELVDALKEHIPGEKKPRGVLTFRPSKEEEWLLYAIHDKGYLLQKYGGGENHEKLPYDWREIVASDGYDVETVMIRSRAYLRHTSSNLATRILEGEDPGKMVVQGENIFTLNGVMKALEMTKFGEVAKENAELKRKLRAINVLLAQRGEELVEDPDGCIEIRMKATDQ